MPSKYQPKTRAVLSKLFKLKLKTQSHLPIGHESLKANKVMYTNYMS